MRLDDLHYRHIRSDDWRRLQRFHSRLSDRTVQLRFHGAKRELSEPLAHRFTDLDGHDNVAIVATTGTRGRIVGVARYYRVGPSQAEAAFVVEDEYQGHGVGHRLLMRLREDALKNGITEFIADVMAGNMPMMHLLEALGPLERTVIGSECEVHVKLI